MDLTTASGGEVFPIGIGTFGIASRENPATAAELRHTEYKNVEPVYGNEPSEIAGLVHSLRRGQNYIDTAELYGAGYTNQVIGQALAIAADAIPREHLFISGNVWKSSYGRIRAATESMLAQLGVDYLDAAGPHSPDTRGWDSPPWQATMPEFRRLVDEGLVRGLTVSNFTIPEIEEAVNLAGLPVITAQMKFSPGHQGAVDTEFRDYCRAKEIQLVAYKPLQPDLVNNGLVKAIAESDGATPAQVALAWTMHMGALPIPKTLNPTHIDENVDAVSIALTASEVEALSGLGRRS